MQRRKTVVGNRGGGLVTGVGGKVGIDVIRGVFKSIK